MHVGVSPIESLTDVWDVKTREKTDEVMTASIRTHVLNHLTSKKELVTIGAGMLYQVSYFPVLAPLDVKDNAYALAFYSYCRQFAAVS